MLSELQVHAHSIQFLCDLKNESKTHSLPPSIILYMRWLPGTTYQTPLSFADGPLSECVRQCLLANGDDAPLGELQLVRSHPREPPYSPRRQHFEELSAQSAECLKKKSPPLGLSSVDSGSPISISSIEAKRPGENNQLTNIYVVVDRISPDTSSNDLPNPPDLCYTSYKSIQKGEQIEPSSQTISSTIQPIQYELFMQQSQSKFYSAEQKESNHHHNDEMKIVEQLARAIASSPFLRNRIDGVTIGLASDIRAAPGLEACMDTVARGAKERRGASRNKPIFCNRNKHQGRRERALCRLRDHSPERSPIAIVACDPDDLESDHDYSHHHHHDTDINNKIFQSRVITEWNGKGDYKTFADRAMRDWRQVWGNSSADNGITNVGSYHGRMRPKVPRISRNEDESEYEREHDFDEPVSTAMILVLLVGILAYLWNLYGDAIYSLLKGDV
jgi:hypothetical protein